METGQLINSLALKPALPLRRRAPVNDEDGRPLGDFMMIIPKLRGKPQRLIAQVAREIEQVLASYRHVVVFADLNVKLNLLWVSVKPRPGICGELARAIRQRVPEALLVGWALS